MSECVCALVCVLSARAMGFGGVPLCGLYRCCRGTNSAHSSTGHSALLMLETSVFKKASGSFAVCWGVCSLNSWVKHDWCSVVRKDRLLFWEGTTSSDPFLTDASRVPGVTSALNHIGQCHIS